RSHTGGGAADVITHGGGHREAAIAGQTGPQRPVAILQVGKESLVQQPDLVEHRATIEGSARAGAKHLPHSLPLTPVHLPGADPPRAAVRRQRVAHAVETVTPAGFMLEDL